MQARPCKCSGSVELHRRVGRWHVTTEVCISRHMTATSRGPRLPLGPAGEREGDSAIAGHSFASLLSFTRTLMRKRGRLDVRASKRLRVPIPALYGIRSWLLVHTWPCNFIMCCSYLEIKVLVCADQRSCLRGDVKPIKPINPINSMSMPLIHACLMQPCLHVQVYT